MLTADFKRSYKKCVIKLPPEYSFRSGVQRTVFCVDCVFRATNRKGEHCDEFVFFCLEQKVTGIYLVERKGGENVIPSKAARQLQGGANFIADFLNGDAALDIYGMDYSPVIVANVLPSVHRKLVETKIFLRRKNSKQNIARSIQRIDPRRKLPRF